MKILLISVCILFAFHSANANDSLQVTKNDSLTIGQAFINLSLTQSYFDTLSVQRIRQILMFEEGELKSIDTSVIIPSSSPVYQIAYSLFFFNHAKLLKRENNITKRELLISIQDKLDKAFRYYSNAKLNDYFFDNRNDSIIKKVEDPFGQLIGFSDSLCLDLAKEIRKFKDGLETEMNENIYPDFKRIFYTAKRSRQFHFDSLVHFAGLFDMPQKLQVLKYYGYNRSSNFRMPSSFNIDNTYKLDKRLEYLSIYLQYKFLADGKRNKSISEEDIDYMHEGFQSFSEEIDFYLEHGNPDNFYKKEINGKRLARLNRKLKRKYPYTAGEKTASIRNMNLPKPGDKKYYFPIPAPFPSAYASINRYKPGLLTLKQVDSHISGIFNGAGYAGHLQYYFVRSGYAMTTGLEKISDDGTPVAGKKRWELAKVGSSSYSFYQVFKSIFFETESNFRTIALVVAPQAASVQKSAATIGQMQDLITYSHPTLPPELEEQVLPEKTLTIMVYHFRQDDIGKVPMLDLSKKISLIDHLKNSGLFNLLYR